MSIIDLLKSPFAIAGIVGSVAIGGGLTVYVVRDGALPGQTAPTTEAFPGKFMVEVTYTHRRGEYSEREKGLPFAYNKDGDEFVYDKALLTCSLVVDRQNGCEIVVTNRLFRLRLHDGENSAISISRAGSTGYLVDHVSWSELRKGVRVGPYETIMAVPSN